MHILGLQRRRVILAAMVFLICRVLVVASDAPTLSKEQIKEFLLTAKVVRSQPSKKGITILGGSGSRTVLCAGGVAWTGRYAASVCRAQMARGRRLAELKCCTDPSFGLIESTLRLNDVTLTPVVTSIPFPCAAAFDYDRSRHLENI
jgi:hypothetical protein